MKKRTNDPEKRLEEALKVIQKHTSLASEATIVPAHPTLLKKFLSFFFPSKRKHVSHQEIHLIGKKLLLASEEIKHCYPLVALSNPKVQSKVKKIIDTYNQKIELKPSLFKRFFRFVFSLFSSTSSSFQAQKIILPSPPSIHASQIVAETPSTIYPKALTFQEKDAFHMKALSLLKNHYPSITKALESIKNTPIQTHASKFQDTITLSQKITPFPGTTLIVKGTFKRSSKGRPKPISQSFALETHKPS